MPSRYPPHQKNQTEQQIKHQDVQKDARWKDVYSAPHASRLAERRAEQKVRREIFGHLPTTRTIASRNPIKIQVDVRQFVATEETDFAALIDSRDLTQLLQKYPLRETPVLNSIAAEVGFRNRTQYEGAVRKLLIDDAAALRMVRNLFGTLFDQISGA